MYHEARTDNKLKHLEDSEFRVWFNLLCFAAEQQERGIIPAHNRYKLAVEVAGGKEDLLGCTLDKLSKLDIISDNGDTITFTHFKERQYDNPSDYPEEVGERVRRHREAKANRETPCNDHVTTGNESATPGNALDTDTDTDKRNTYAQPDAPDGACVPVPKPQPKSKEAYSEDFERFWGAYPRKVEKQRAWRCWKTRLREGFEPEMLIEAAENYAAECRRAGTDERYRKHAATFLGPDKPFLEWLDIRAGPDDECHNPAHRDVTEEALREAAEIDWGDEDE